MFGTSKEDVTGSWRIMHKDENHICYSSRNIIRMIKSRRIRRPLSVAHI
jgi:hypothetical protein